MKINYTYVYVCIYYNTSNFIETHNNFVRTNEIFNRFPCLFCLFTLGCPFSGCCRRPPFGCTIFLLKFLGAAITLILSLEWVERMIRSFLKFHEAILGLDAFQQTPIFLSQLEIEYIQILLNVQGICRLGYGHHTIVNLRIY